jgi:hypothetical protein
MDTPNSYVTSGPNAQVAIDIFKGEWSSILPPGTAVTGGRATLFDDNRIKWADQQLGGFLGYKVLELGPLEAGHTYMLEKRGAASVLAIEANTRAYLKCLIIKEIMELQHSQFLLGDFMEYLRAQNEKFDFCLASGVLYHVMNPVELIHLVSLASPRVYFWTHYYDEQTVRDRPELTRRFSGSENAEFAGFPHKLYKYEYGSALEWRGFCGGTSPHSRWLSREDILGSLRYFGFGDVRVAYDTLDHPNGPSFAVLAIRER